MSGVTISRRFAMYGFTLIELLVALVVLSIMLSLVLSSLQFVVSANAQVETVTDNNDRYFQVHQFLRRQLSQIEPNVVLDQERLNNPDFNFVASARKLQFIAPLASHSSEPGLYRLKLEIEDRLVDGFNRQQLVMEATVLVQPGTALRRVLLVDEQRIRWSYWARQPHGAFGWTDNWRDPALLPELIRLEVNSGNNDSNWSEFVVGPRIHGRARFDVE